MSVRINGTTGVTTPNLTATTKVTTADLTNTGNYNGGQLSNRNLIINGEFDVDQRGLASSTSFASGAHFVADRWDYYTNAGAIATYSATHEISDDAPSGFTKSLKVTCTSGGSIPATGEVIYRQNIEGYLTKRLSYGEASAKSVTLSFWIKASVTGDYGVQLIYEADGGANRFYVTKYTVNSANTWEYKTITIPPNTVDAFNHTTNDLGVQLYWDLGEGSTYSGAADSGWTSTYYNGLSGGVKLMENTGATWQKTGVQLEVGDTATPFEHRSYGDELARCQRYCYVFKQENSQYGGLVTFANAYSSANIQGGKPLPVQMRAKPTLTFTGNIQVSEGTNLHNSSATSVLGNGSSVDQLHFWIGNFSGLTTNQGYFANMQTSGQIFIVDAEL